MAFCKTCRFLWVCVGFFLSIYFTSSRFYFLQNAHQKKKGTFIDPYARMFNSLKVQIFGIILDSKMQ